MDNSENTKVVEKKVDSEQLRRELKNFVSERGYISLIVLLTLSVLPAQAGVAFLILILTIEFVDHLDDEGIEKVFTYEEIEAGEMR